MNIRRAASCFVTLAAILFASPAHAQCSISSTTIPFGSVDLIAGTNMTATGTVSINCPGGFGSFSYLWICTSIGVGANSTSVNTRTMKSGANTPGYQLYTDSGMTNV